jgi:hypothetical protein
MKGGAHRASGVDCGLNLTGASGLVEQNVQRGYISIPLDKCRHRAELLERVFVQRPDLSGDT